MSLEGLQRLAEELSGSNNPPFKEFGERIREELVRVVDIPAGLVPEEGQGAGDTPDEQTPEEPKDDEAPLPEEPPTEEAEEEPESESPAEQVQDQKAPSLNQYPEGRK